MSLYFYFLWYLVQWNSKHLPHNISDLPHKISDTGFTLHVHYLNKTNKVIRTLSKTPERKIHKIE